MVRLLPLGKCNRIRPVIAGRDRLTTILIHGVTQSMEARLSRAAIVAAAFLSLGAGYRTENFIVTAP